MKTPACFFAVAILSTTLHGARTADFEGAEAILKQIAERHNPQAATPAANGDTREKLKTDLEAFRKSAPTLAPDEAAKDWLDLADRFSKLPPQTANPGDEYENPYYWQQQFGFGQVVASLPPPAAWEALAKAVDARPAEGKNGDVYHTILLRLIANRLTRDNASLNKDIDALAAALKKGGGDGSNFSNPLPGQLRAMLMEDSDNGAGILKQLDESIAIQAPTGQPRGVSVPDLVSLLGKDKAADFLRRALRGNNELAIQNGDETMQLARKLALEMAAELKAPQWDLVLSTDTTALYEVMQKRFPVSNGNDYGQYQARSYYLLGLIAAHRTKEATALAASLGPEASRSLPEAAITAMERAGRTTELADFFHDLLAQSPDLPFWGDYVDLAVKAGQEKKMLALVEAAAARTGLSDAEHQRILGYLSHAYLATDRVDDGIAIIRKEIADAKARPNMYSVLVIRHANQFMEEETGVGQIGLELAAIGAVLDRKDLVDEGVQTARDALKAKSLLVQRNYGGGGAVSLAGFLIEQDRGPEAEAVLKDALVRMPQNSYANSSEGKVYLALLMDIYDRAKRPADVLALLDGAPCWGAKDLANPSVLMQSVNIDRNVDYAGFFAADALAASGKTAEARKVLDALMDSASDYDPGYELLIKIAPRDEALARLDAMFARDKFEPRPLIWKAKLLLDAGKLEEAEAAARQAVTIDPSDGEHGPGRRMRVYSVLADIRAARGDNKEAEFFRGVVTAIRHSEDADRFYEAGLVTRAIKMYEESLTHFADAYCIQSRLALRMAEVGDMAGAEEHYKRAYELMPDSFGRVESHCFGCEGAFQGAYAQNIAEKVFTDLAKKRPDKPQVHYLLGYLRVVEENYREALPEFREAVKLDPEYLNAWKKLGEIGSYLRLPAAEADSVEFSFLRLDPLGRHSSFSAAKVVDLAAAWNALDAAAKLRPVEPTELYPLPASAAELAKQEKEKAANPGAFAMRQMYYNAYYRGNPPGQNYPGGAIAQNQFIQSVSQIYSAGQMFNGGAPADFSEDYISVP